MREELQGIGALVIKEDLENSEEVKNEKIINLISL